jgi:hypothetical protein
VSKKDRVMKREKKESERKSDNRFKEISFTQFTDAQRGSADGTLRSHCL